MAQAEISGQSAESKQALDNKDAHNWPGLLGPYGTGHSDETGLLDEWPKEGPPVVWKKEIGTGYSAPSVTNGRLVFHHRIGGNEIVECVEAATGEPIWSQQTRSRFQDPYGYNNGPRCSPVLTPTRCFTLGAEGKLLCLNLEDGAIIWERNLRDDFTIPEGFFGIGATPVLEKDKLIVAVGGQPNSGIVAFAAETGEILWESVGENTWDGAETGWPSPKTYTWEGDEMVVSYSSPMAVTIHGRRHLLCFMRQGLVSVDPETGEELFHFWFRARVHESVNAAQPVVVEDTILLGAAYRAGSVLLGVNPDGTSVKTIWREPQILSTHWSTTLFAKGCYFGFSGRHENEGVLQCVDAATGKVKWQSTGWERVEDLQQDGVGRVVDGKTGGVIPWPFYGRGSAIIAEDKLIVLGERGTLALLKVDTDRWVEVSRFAAPEMKYPSWTAPVLSGGRLFLRCEDALVCLDIAAKK
ncbi:PQQ-binding-like beta-propeller repeat protein [Planctomicrobium sp. SH668]|uniref:outer membrane protein assembly factor BamB family protein n=1 Tax=Planctomicrobium sp. SH668 TaxID=3448126 RepID=UPI003F5C1A5E